MDKFWEIKNKTEDSAELLLYGDIASRGWWEDDVTPQNINEELEELDDVEEINVRINSNGGDVFAGNAILSTLKRFDATVNIFIDGLAASIASVIAMAGDKVYMPVNSMMMVHNPWTGLRGDADDFRKMADDLDQIRESIIAAYKEKTSLNRDEIIDFLDQETWFTAEEAVEYGFADEIEEREVSASINNKSNIKFNNKKFDLSDYNNIPDELFNNKSKTSFNNKFQSNKGGSDKVSKFKEFETEEAYNAHIDNIKNDFKDELMGDNSFLNSIDDVVMKNDVMDKLNEVVKGESVDEVVENIKTVKTKINELETENSINERKNDLNEAGLTLADLDVEDKEELGDFDNFDKTVELIKKAKSKQNKSDDIPETPFDPNMHIDGDDDAEVTNLFN